MLLDDLVAFVGHRIHVVRAREGAALTRLLGRDTEGLRILDVAGGDGYWIERIGAHAAVGVNVDLAWHKLVRGRRLRRPPDNVYGNALQLPFGDSTFDAVLSICAIEHFSDGGAALDEIARVLRPGGALVMSADALTMAGRWPHLEAAHRRKYAVVDTYDRVRLAGMLAQRGFRVSESLYHFRAPWAQHLYLGLSRLPRVALNAAWPLAAIVAASDRRRRDGDDGSVLLLRAVKER